ncbi:MAG: hypothetical protein JO091_13500, partial [Acidobacteriaceae bacterium]|nr:hypothetical protein [Acidobacteriaceae bacterium]
SGEWWIVPVYHIFGSEELSAQAPAIAELAPRPYVAIHPADAADLNVSVEDLLTVTLGDASIELPVVLRNDVPHRVALVPAGIVPGFAMPGRGQLMSIAVPEVSK